MIDLKAIAKTAKKHDGYFVCWSGVYFDTAHRFLRVDKLFLNAVYCDREKNKVVFRRVSARMQRDAKKEPFLSYSLDPQYKITSGVRRGRMVLVSEVKDDETFTYAGLSKNLEFGNGSNQFNPRRRVKDITTLKLLTHFNNLKDVDNPTQIMPDVYLTCHPKNNGLYVRKNGAVMQRLSVMPGYDSSVDVDKNARRLKSSFREQAGDGRVAYPFDMFYGKGVLAAKLANDVMMLGQWYRVKEFNSENHHVHFHENESKKNINKDTCRT
jgi:hypothetical protein